MTTTNTRRTDSIKTTKNAISINPVASLNLYVFLLFFLEVLTQGRVVASRIKRILKMISVFLFFDFFLGFFFDREKVMAHPQPKHSTPSKVLHQHQPSQPQWKPSPAQLVQTNYKQFKWNSLHLNPSGANRKDGMELRQSNKSEIFFRFFF